MTTRKRQMMRNLGKALAALMAGCFSMGATAAAQPQDEGPEAHAVLIDANGHQIGTAEIGENDGILHVAVDVNHLPAGRYAVHIHSIGRCDGPRFESAGGHWNPTNAHHGIENSNGPHMGDLPNLAINANGRGFSNPPSPARVTSAAAATLSWMPMAQPW
jgi:superoxide dismutase, Cu-Zn family